MPTHWGSSSPSVDHQRTEKRASARLGWLAGRAVDGARGSSQGTNTRPRGTSVSVAGRQGKCSEFYSLWLLPTNAVIFFQRSPSMHCERGSERARLRDERRDGGCGGSRGGGGGRRGGWGSPRRSTCCPLAYLLFGPPRSVGSQTILLTIAEPALVCSNRVR